VTGRPTTLLRRLVVDLEPLRHANFRRLWISNGVSFTGFQVTAVAVPVQVFAMSHSSLWVGVLGLAGFAPLLIFGLWGGALADAMDRRRLLLIGSLVTWSCTLGLLVQALLGARSVALLIALTAVQAGGFAVSSTRGALIPRLVPTELVPAANTLNFTASSVATVAGPLLAGVVLGRWSYAAAYALDAVLYTVALYAALRLPTVEPIGGGSRPGFRSVVDGLRFVVAQPILALSFVVDLIAMIVAMPRALFPQAAEERFGGAAAVGWLYASIAIGSVVGGVLSGWVGRVRHQGVALVLAIAAWGVLVAAAGLARSLLLCVVLLAAAGAADLVSAVYRQTVLQVHAPDRMRGRLQGVFTVVVAGGPRLGDLRAGGIAALTGLTVSWVGGGIVCAVLVLLLLAYSSTLRRYPVVV
jgi:MFS family permease